MKRSKFAFFLVFLLVTNLHAQPLKCSVRAKSAILYNPDTGSILFQKEAHQPHHPASILKIATAIFALNEKKIELNAPCLVSKGAMAIMNAAVKQANFDAYPPHILEHDGVMTGIKVGQTYSFNTLLHALLLRSGNDAGNVIAEACSGSIETFMEELNRYLQSKGLTKTRFYNPHGLHHPNQVTTAYEMAQIATLAFNNPTCAEILKTVSYEGENSLVILNKIVKSGKYNYPKSLGGKLGYTSDAGYNFVAAAEENGRRLIVVLLGCVSNGDRFTEAFKEAMSLFETAFREQKKERFLFAKDHECFVRKIPKAARPLKGRLDQDVIVSYYPSEERELRARLAWNEVKLPIAAGMEVGKLIVEDEKGKTIVEAPLFAETGLKKSIIYQIIDLSKQIAIWGFALLALIWIVKLLKKRSKIDKG